MTLLEGICVSGMVKMNVHAAGAGCCGCLNVCGTDVEPALELHESVCCCSWYCR